MLGYVGLPVLAYEREARENQRSSRVLRNMKNPPKWLQKSTKMAPKIHQNWSQIRLLGGLGGIMLHAGFLFPFSSLFPPSGQHLGANLGAKLDPSWAKLGADWTKLGPGCAMLDHLGALLDHLAAILEPC